MRAARSSVLHDTGLEAVFVHVREYLESVLLVDEENTLTKPGVVHGVDFVAI